MATSIDYNADNASNDIAALSIGSNEPSQIEYKKSDVIGEGSSGTFVFRGKYTRKYTYKVEDVAVKRIQTRQVSVDDHFSEQLQREVTALQSLRHTNVIKYIDVEERGEFLLIALQLCLGSLVNIVTPGHKKDIDRNSFKKYKTNLWSTKKILLKDAANGLDYIHRKGIVHRDLKPENILIIVDESNADLLKAVISDFSLCKELKTVEFRPSRSLIGSQGWMPKEILKKKELLPIPRAVDVFAFGCIVHFVMSFKRYPDHQIHPFGENDLRHYNIKGANRVTYLYENNDPEHTPSGDTILADILIGVCVSSDPKIRPSTDEIVSHPFFWSYAKRKEYVCEHFNSKKSKSPTAVPLKRLKSNWRRLCPNKEFHNDIKEVWEYVDLYSKTHHNGTPNFWKSDIFNGIMRIIRNLTEHWTDAVSLHPPLNDLFGNSDLGGNCDHEKMGFYFFEKIPVLFPIIYVSFMSEGVLNSNDPSNQKKIEERQDKIYTLAVQTLKRVLKPAKPAGLKPAKPADLKPAKPADLKPANLEPVDLKPGCS